MIDQLQTALNTRVVIEQAKGVVAQQGSIAIDVAFSRMRKFSRDSNLTLSEIARRIVDGRLDPEDLPLQT